ncbi:unnamed protein product [Cuscuta campestris]|uniref:Uncharacterized protein n=1 Tax=Cuscuta campestris TaxID=132261 RepID=A0A484LW11_9ASTE|nr:unnamed protein product [Cuscuta campestris]
MISHIKDNKGEWTCKVRVVEKRNIRDSRSSPNKYRPYVLQDHEIKKPAEVKEMLTPFNEFYGISASKTPISTWLGSSIA